MPVHRFVSRDDLLRREEHAQARELLGQLRARSRPEAALAFDKIEAEVDRQSLSSRSERFVPMFTAENRRVVEYLSAPGVCRRPLVAVRLWALLWEFAVHETNVIALTREECADKLGVSVRDVSRIMSVLVDCKAVLIWREPQPGMRGPGLSRYKLNCVVGGGPPHKARELKRAAAPVLAFPRGGKPRSSERRSRAPVVAPLVL